MQTSDGMRSLGQVIATRELRFHRACGSVETVSVSIGAPVFEDLTWWCPIEIRSPSFTRARAMAGADSLQALLATLSLLATEIAVLAKEHGGTFQFLGMDDLMLPGIDWLRSHATPCP